MIRTVRGSILDAREKYICHQVNCRNAMGSGLAKALYEKWPQVKSVYHEVTSWFVDPADLLGMFYLVRVEDAQCVINIYGQLNYGRDKSVVYTNYEALREAFTTMDRRLHGDFAFPYGFGCGLANGDWETVYGLIQECFQHNNVTIYQLD